MALRVIGFVSQRNAKVSEALADYVIRPDLSPFGPYDLDRADELIRVGYETAKECIPAIREAIRAKQRTPEIAAEEDRDWSRMVRWLRDHSPVQLFGRKTS